MASAASSIVAGKVSTISEATPRRKWIEAPRSPFNVSPSQIAYCSGKGAIEPHLLTLHLDLGLGGVRRHRHRGRIDRKHAQHDEDESGDDEEDRDRDEKPPGEEAEKLKRSCRLNGHVRPSREKGRGRSEK